MTASRRMLALLAMYAMVRANTKEEFFEETEEKKEPIIPKGLKKFDIDGKVVYAINLKNAQRKAK